MWTQLGWGAAGQRERCGGGLTSQQWKGTTAAEVASHGTRPPTLSVRGVVCMPRFLVAVAPLQPSQSAARVASIEMWAAPVGASLLARQLQEAEQVEALAVSLKRQRLPLRSTDRA